MNVFDLFATLSLDTSDYDKGLQNAEGKALSFGDVLQANLISAAVEKGMSLLIDGIRTIGSVIEQNMGTAVKRLDTLNSYGKTMEALGFTIEQATAAQSALSEAIDGLPTTLDGIISWQQQFTALSDDIEYSTDLTIALNNATLAAGKGQEAANNAMGNWYAIIAAGAPDAQHWQSLYSTMPAQMNQLAEAMLGAGAKSDDLYAAWKNGIVTTEDVTAALISLNDEGLNGVASFADQAQIGAQTIETAYGNINTAIGRNIANVLDVLNGDATEGGGRIVELLLNVKGLINDIGAAVTTFVKDHEPQITAIMDALNAILGGGDIAANLETIKTNATSLISDILAAVTSALPDVISFAGTVIEVLLSALIENAPAIVTAALSVITELITGLSDPVAMQTLANSAVEIVTVLVEGISMALPVIVPAALTIVTTIISTLTSPENIDKLLQATLLLLGAIVMALAQSIPVYIEYFVSMWTNLAGLFDGAVQWVATNIAPALVQIATDLITAFNQWVADLVAGAQGLSQQIFDELNYLTGGIYGDVQQFLIDMIVMAVTFFTDLYSQYREMMLGTVWPAIIKFFTDIWNKLVEFKNNAISSITSFFASGWQIYTSWCANVRAHIIDFIMGIRERIHNGMSAAKDTVSNVLNSIKSTFSNIFETVKTTVSNAIEYIKGLFNFEWSLPSIKLPHFSITGSLDLLATPPTYPTVSVSWYKKAMENPYLLDGATIFGAAGGKLLGGGESGSEMIIGTNKLMSMMKEAVGASQPITINIYGAEGQDVRELAKQVSLELQNLINDKEAVYA